MMAYKMKILLVDLLYIGDLLFLTPAIRVLSNAYPHAEIDVLVNSMSAPVLQHNPLIHRVISFSTKPRIDTPQTLFSVLRELRREHYDLAISFHGGNERAAILTGLSGAKRRGGFVKPPFHHLFTRKITTPVNDLIVQAPKHVTEIYIDLLSAMGVPHSSHNALEMWPGDEAIHNAEQMWADIGLSGKQPVIGIVSNASFAAKKWTIAGNAKLCDLLTQAGMTPLLFGSPADQEFVEAICKASSSNPISLAGRTSLLQLAALMRRCALIVAVDTGPCHIAASQHVPIVAIYSRTIRQVYAPLGTEYLFVAGDVSCLECNKSECDDMRCMTELSAERVFQSVQELQAHIASFR